uniref:tetratricopeptide repeat protein n=1 Tax=Marinobacterium profundum TaxID=1714300 RepID=UPI0009E8B409|nr:tetratricopeptide repeat protein [Marinobacterium profundum]
MGCVGKRVSVSLWALVLLSGCDSGSDTSSSAAIQSQPGLSVPVASVSLLDSPAKVSSGMVGAQGRRPLACELVQAQFEADRTVTDIEQIQQQLRGNEISYSRRLELLERLGWRHLALARETFDAGYLKLAEQAGNCMNAQVPGSAAAQLLLARSLHQQHRFAESQVLALELVSSRGGWFDYGLLGDLQLEQGDLEAAASAYQRMMDLHPGPQAYSRAAELRWLNGDSDGAIEMMALSARSTSARQPEAKAWALARLASFVIAQGDADTALTLVRAALEIRPNYPPALLLSGRLWLARGDYARAVEQLQRAAIEAPQPLYQWPLLEALEQAGKVEAQATLQAQLARRGADADRRTYALYLASTSTSAAALSRALTLAQQEYAIRQDPLTLDTLALAQYRQGDLVSAWNLISSALASGLQDPRVQLHAGMIAAARGDCQQAQNWLNRARQPAYRLLPSEQRMLAQARCSASEQQLSNAVLSRKALLRP